MEWLSVGDLAQASGLSPASVRRYADTGVLVAARVEPDSGYRWFGTDQVERAVLVRTLRGLDVPLGEVTTILDQPDAAARLARLEQHWGRVQDRLDRGRADHDHVARLFSGFQSRIDAFVVTTGTTAEVGAIMRRRTAHLDEIPELTRDSCAALSARAGAEGRSALGDPVLRYSWPPDRQDVEDVDARRVVEICLPVDGDPDVVLPGGRTATTEVRDDDVLIPERLAAYGAVSQWARTHRHRLVGPPLEWVHDERHLTVGWLVESRPAGE